MDHRFTKIVRLAQRAILLSSTGSLVAAVPAAAAMQKQVDVLVEYQFLLALVLASMLMVQYILKGVRRLEKLKVAMQSVQDPHLTRERLDEIRQAHLGAATENRR